MKTMMKHLLLLGAITATVLGTTACAPLLLGGAMVGGAMVATDRRTSGTQLEDQGIELKAAARIREQLGDRVHINVNSYNRVALITGEANTEADKAALTRIVGGVENVSNVLNEVSVGFHSSLTQRSNDVLLATKIKATLIDAKDVMSNAFYVVVERGDAFLMGRVTEREAKRASELIRGIAGVNKVVRAFEVISEEELARLSSPPVKK